MQRLSIRYCVVASCVAFALADIPPAMAQKTTVAVHGYAKNLAIRSSSPLTDEPFVLDVSRFRARGILLVGAHLSVEAWLDTELLFSSFLDTEDYALAMEFEQPRFLDLDWPLASGPSLEARQRLFRAFSTLYAGPAEVRVGRQRIAWGTGFAWNPTDILNPFNPGAIELGERAGVDAAYASIALGAVSRLELVAAVGESLSQTSYAARFGANYREFDLSAMGALLDEDWVIGGDFAGYLRSAGVRGEAAYAFKADGSRYLRAILNADYSFEVGLYALMECYYNGQGARDKTQYDIEALLRGETFSLARWYAATSVGGGLSPLWGGALYALVNLDDKSALLGPSVTYSLAENLEIAASTYFLIGRGDTEFGAQRHIVFAALQYYY